MEGVGARLGRSSTRYGPATVFTGPVRKWKKKWVHVASSSGATGSHGNGSANHSLHNGTAVNGVNGSHLLLYKWTPLSQSQNAAANNGNGNGNGDSKVVDSSKDDSAPEEPPRRKFKYVPTAVLEEQKHDAEDESAEKETDEAKPIDVDSATKDDNLDEKPDINDVPMDETEDTNKVVCQDLNESTLDLSLGLNGHDDENEPDSKAGDR